MNTASFFESFYKHSQSNSILIMDTNGLVIQVNGAFTNNYGYDTDDLKGQSFEILFTRLDKEKKLPEKELKKVTSTGQANDDNYVVDKGGISKRSSGESILVTTPEGQRLIVKYIVNLHAKKYLRLFFTEVDKLLQTTISNSSDVPMMVLDRSMKISEVNAPFMELFGISEKPRKGTSLANLQHPFWRREDVRQEIRGTIVNNTPLRRKRFHLELGKKKTRKIIIDSKIIEGPTGGDKKVFLMIDENE